MIQGDHKHDVALCLLNVWQLISDAAVALNALAGFDVCLPPSGQNLIDAALNEAKFEFVWF